MPRINEEDVNTLRERADVVEIVSAYTRLKRSGTNTFKGLCPFHSEKTPSFQVDAAKGLFHCFGCGAGGNIYHFVQKVESLPFQEAVEWLARKSGFDLRYEETRPGEIRSAGMRARLLAANNEAMAFFHKALVSSPDALEARRYLESRGFGRDVAERWKLGYGPGRDSLCRHLLAKGFTDQEILQGDLGKRGQRDGRLYDSFRQRIIFPTWNVQGDVVGFGARALGDQQPKYLNTAETPLFSKSRVMYGLHRAKSSIARGNPAVVVEGYTDVIALHEAGIEEAVATNGVALGETHFELLKKFTQRAILMLDPDTAGKGATERSFEIHHKIGLEVMAAPLPVGRDPADVIKEDGVEGIRKAIEVAQPLLQFKLEEALAKVPLDTPEAKSRAVTAAARVLSWQPDPIARSQYVFLAAERIGIDAAAVERALEEAGTRGEEGEAASRTDEDRRLPGPVKVEREALQLLVTRSREVGRWIEDLVEQDFTSNARRELFRAVQDLISAHSSVSESELAEKLSPDALSLYSELTVGRAPEAAPEGAQEVFIRLRIFRLEREIKLKQQTLQELNPVTDAERHDLLFTELVKLEAERRDLRRRLQG